MVVVLNLSTHASCSRFFAIDFPSISSQSLGAVLSTTDLVSPLISLTLSIWTFSKIALLDLTAYVAIYSYEIKLQTLLDLSNIAANITDGTNRLK